MCIQTYSLGRITCFYEIYDVLASVSVHDSIDCSCTNAKGNCMYLCMFLYCGIGQNACSTVTVHHNMNINNSVNAVTNNHEELM